jgi:hypothetical protein
MHRESVDQWYEHISDIYRRSSDPAVYVLHDLRSPNVHFSAFSMSRARDLTTVRPELGGGAAIVVSGKDSIQLSVMRNFSQDPRLPRVTRIFYDYDSAVEWLCSLMHE